jgi:CubicO group peptidase (beta-lactamase class C family)
MHSEIDRVLRESVVRGDLVGAAAAVVTPKGTWAGAAGEAVAGTPMTAETVVWIASITKAITAVAVMQLVEQSRIDLDAPCREWVPFLNEVPVLHGFADDGSPRLRPAMRPVTLRHLLTHTSGFGYEFADARLARYVAEQGLMGRAGWSNHCCSNQGSAGVAANHLGDLSVTGWRTVLPAYSNEVDFFPGMRQGWGLSSLINTETTPEGRSPGSLSWGGLANTYYWVDPTRQVGGVLATQILPFFDAPALATFRAVERVAYESL